MTNKELEELNEAFEQEYQAGFRDGYEEGTKNYSRTVETLKDLINRMSEKTKQLTAERDALLKDVTDYQGSICCYCKHIVRDNEQKKVYCGHFGDFPTSDGMPIECGRWEWSGLSLETKTSDKEKCPICEYDLGQCQCIYGGSGHPDRSKRRKVVFDHLYLFTEKQIKHLIWLEKYWSTSYVDEELEEILDSLKPPKEVEE